MPAALADTADERMKMKFVRHGGGPLGRTDAGEKSYRLRTLATRTPSRLIFAPGVAKFPIRVPERKR
jgi:hypothetical protein